MTRRAIAISQAIILLAVTAAGCRKNAENPVPRPVAYPRIELYAPDYDSIVTPVVVLPVNKSAVTTVEQKSDSNLWINAVYPRYRATLRYTISSHGSKGLADAIDNRLTRMSLNAGGNTTEIIELQSPAEISSTIFVTPGATVTPVQILSTDSTRFIISGVLEINSPSATREEIAPVVAAVKDDLLYTAKNLSRR